MCTRDKWIGGGLSRNLGEEAYVYRNLARVHSRLCTIDSMTTLPRLSKGK